MHKYANQCPQTVTGGLLCSCCLVCHATSSLLHQRECGETTKMVKKLKYAINFIINIHYLKEIKCSTRLSFERGMKRKEVDNGVLICIRDCSLFVKACLHLGTDHLHRQIYVPIFVSNEGYGFNINKRIYIFKRYSLYDLNECALPLNSVSKDVC